MWAFVLGSENQTCKQIDMSQSHWTMTFLVPQCVNYCLLNSVISITNHQYVYLLVINLACAYVVQDCACIDV